ncbi:MAG: T9SS type B sorting domain-containing protein, partial [Bacteroidales bacterium]|jgi:gliding motility-associated-like protein|nr:T9SS type B sorting domain-containing protein [Bacteroidales bacterium]
LRTFSITVDPTVLLDTIEDRAVCAGENQSILFTGINIVPDSCIWVNSNPAIGLGPSGNGNISFVATNTDTVPLTAIITVSPRGVFHCIDQPKTFFITVNPLPIPDSIENITSCAGIRQNIYFTGININPDSSVWTNSLSTIGLDTTGTGNISFITANNDVVPLTATITMIPKSDNGCAALKTFTITTNPLPLMDSIEDVSVCTGIRHNIDFTGINMNPDSSVWTNTNPTIGLDRVGSGNISFITTNNSNLPLTSVITLIPKNDNGCVAPAKTFSIKINPFPIMDSIENIAVCTGIDQRFNFTGMINPDSCSWTNNNPSIGLDTVGKGNISFITINHENIPVTSVITVTPKNNDRCIGNSRTFSITVYPEIHLHIIANDSLFCEGSDIMFEVTNENTLNSIQWNGPDGFSSSIYNPDIQNTSLDNSGIYVVNAITKDNCDAIPDSINIAVLPNIILDMEDTLFICNSKAIIHANATNANQYKWNTGNTKDSIIVADTGNYWVVTNNQRCQESDTTYVAEIIIPSFEIKTRGDLCEEGYMELFVEIGMDNLSYHWTSGDTAKNIVISQNGVYGIAVTYSGCTVLQDVRIECPCDFWIPNTFTPNGDTHNETFAPVPKSVLNSFAIYIYDRWDNLIFYADTLIPWDGTYNGNYAKADVYTYVILYTCANNPDDKRKKQGMISLIR